MSAIIHLDRESLFEKKTDLSVNEVSTVTR